MPADSPSHGLLGDTAPSTRGAIAFAIAAFAGAIAIVAGKYWGLEQYQITLLPIAVMVIYTITILSPKFRLRSDSAGDNLYYLGFLYTLTSISVALYSFASEDSGPQIITNFGVAIATTIFGLALRIMLNQMRLDPAEVERSSRLELAEASRRMRRELDDAAMELNVFRRSIVQSTQDFAKEIQDSLNETFKVGLKESGEKARTFYGEVDALHKDVVESLKSITDDTKSVAQSIKTVSKQLAKIQTPDKMLELNFEPSFKLLQDLLSDFRSSQSQHAERFMALLSNFDQHSSESLHRLAEMRDILATIASRISSKWSPVPRDGLVPKSDQFPKRKSSRWAWLRVFGRR